MQRLTAVVRGLLIAVLLAATLAHAQVDGLSAEQQEFEQKIADMVAVRTEAYRFASDNGIAEAKRLQFTREQSNRLRDIARRYIEARKALLPDAEMSSLLFQHKGALILTTNRSTQIETVPLVVAAESTVPPQHWINPNDAAGQQMLMRIMRGLAAAMVLWDSHRIAVTPYEKNESIQYLLTYDVSGDTSLRGLANDYYSPDLRTRLVNATRFVDNYMSWRRSQQLPANPEESYLYTLTQSTLWYSEIRESGSISLSDSLRYVGDDIRLQRQELGNLLSHGLSMGFGNMIGLVQTRRGLLSKMPAEDIEKLAGELKPLDILLEKTPFRLTDKMIPGHYGHVAVWLGSEAELKALAVWDRIAPEHQEQIKKGGRIVEALRGGVTISTLPHFLNIDDLLVLRDQRPLSDEYRRQAILTALEQVGKEYDFNFDVYTHQRIVCSELAYVVFPDVNWPLARTLGRYTISPDNVAQMAVGPKPIFAPVIVYLDGRRVNEGLDRILADLIRRETQQLAISTEPPGGGPVPSGAGEENSVSR